MSRPVPAIDHAVVNVLDRLDAAADQYGRLGFRLTARGHHSLGSSNHLAIFATDYLELLGYEPGNETKRADLWRHPAGLTGLVFKATDPDALYADLRARGVPVEPPLEFRRPVQVAEGARDASFRVIRVAPELIENGRTFFCHHFTPELVWRREWQDHPNGVTGIAEFVIAARDPTRTANVYSPLRRRRSGECRRQRPHGRACALDAVGRFRPALPRSRRRLLCAGRGRRYRRAGSRCRWGRARVRRMSGSRPQSMMISRAEEKRSID